MISALKILLVVLGFLVERGASAEDGPGVKVEIGRALDFLAALALTSFIAIQVGAFTVTPIEPSGYDAIGPLIAALLMLGLKAVFFVLLPTALICWFLRSFAGLTPRLVVYGAFASAGLAAWHFAQQRTQLESRLEVERAAAQMATQARVQRQAESLEQARQDAATREEETQVADRQRLVTLTLEVRQRWRDDVRTARAFGLEGDRPPMLRVVDEGPYLKKVTNFSAHKVCVQVARVIRQQRADDYLRCQQDLSSRCRTIGPGASVTFNVAPHSTNAACERGGLEWRVGTPLWPEPTWWSVSALADFDQHPVDPRDLAEEYARMGALEVRSEVQRLEALLAETDRAARWARESMAR